MMKNSRRSNALRRYLRLLEAYCPDTLHVWMPKFDGRRTSSATYDLVSGTALNLGSGAAFSGDGKRIVLESGEVATADVVSRPYAYIGIIGASPPDVGFLVWASGEYNMRVKYSSYWPAYYADPSYDGSSYSGGERVRANFSSPPANFVVTEFVCNSAEIIARSPQESTHVDSTPTAPLYATNNATLQLHLGTNTIEVAALIYGGATTSAPLESLASVVKSGESGSLLTEMFRELI